jgi:hypothetical protein
VRDSKWETNEDNFERGSATFAASIKSMSRAGADAGPEQTEELISNTKCVGAPVTTYYPDYTSSHAGPGSQRGIAWRCSDSLSLRKFLGIPMIPDSPDHSSLTVIRDRLPLEVHDQVFTWVLALAKEKKLLDGKVLAIDSTTLEANAAMKTIVRRDSEENWREYVAKLMR